jgi:hypothetical protein
MEGILLSSNEKMKNGENNTIKTVDAFYFIFCRTKLLMHRESGICCMNNKENGNTSKGLHLETRSYHFVVSCQLKWYKNYQDPVRKGFSRTYITAPHVQITILRGQ